VDLACAPALLLELLPDDEDLEMRQPVDFQLENGIGLVGVEIEARDDLLRRVRLAVRLSHDPEDLVERVEDFLEAVEDVRPLPERLGFTYAVFILTASTDAVTPGGQLSVSWIAPSATHGDWIGLFKVGDPNTSYGGRWWKYTDGATSGTLALSAPMEPGQYEFRYLLDDDFIDVVRSSPVRVN